VDVKIRSAQPASIEKSVVVGLHVGPVRLKSYEQEMTPKSGTDQREVRSTIIRLIPVRSIDGMLGKT
jgi:hypothetical protein